jgi:hypothetical protein
MSRNLAITPTAFAQAGAVIQHLAAQRLDEWARQEPGFISEVIAPNRHANCAVLGLKIPEGSTIVAIRYFAADGQPVSSCPIGVNNWPICKVGWSRWQPAVTTANGAVVAVFKNWSHNLDRDVALQVEFIPPAGVTPKEL